MTRIRTALALGIGNIFHVLSYRLRLRLGIHPVQALKAAVPQTPFFYTPAQLRQGIEPAPRPPDTIPNWHGDTPDPLRPWWTITDFDGGDIKTVWQPSRFEWVLAFAQHAALGDTTAIVSLNACINDWAQKNPPYLGVNWKCGQEASIRVINLALAAHILQQTHQPAAGLQHLIAAHLPRINATRHYAIAQDNNHGVTEAVGLFVGGSWLGDAHAHTGRQQLEERVRKLVMTDGSFSLYSVNYHRMVLDTLTIAELWRAANKLPPFSDTFYERARAMTLWLHTMIDKPSGDAPNLGAHDGTCMLKLSPADERNFRPALQRAAAVFLKAGTGADASMAWLGINTPTESLADATDRQFDDGGFTVARRGDAMALLRYPRFTFRPIQADLLHVDFWHKGSNLLRDAGTFSYADMQAHQYFSGIASHNTVQFDAREPMPRLGRFLFGDWVKAQHVEPFTDIKGTARFGASYTDRHGARHARTVHLNNASLRVSDEVSGFKHQAVLRWRLPAGEWTLDGATLTGHGYQLTVECSAPIARAALVHGWESRYYLQRNPVTVLEIEIHQAATLTTQLLWSA